MPYLVSAIAAAQGIASVEELQGNDECQSSSSMNIQMKLSIVRLDHSIAEIKKTSPGIGVGSLSRAVLDDLSCQSATGEPASRKWLSFARNTSCNFNLKEELIKKIMRYVKEPDRWTAFSSLLLKSIAFHRHIDPSMSVDVSAIVLPVIDLPRTKFNRPFLPQTVTGNSSRRVTDEEVEECRESVMSISHQFPYLCMIHKQRSDHTSTQLPHDMLGCDVVMFEPRLNEYSPTISDFLKPFVGCFTSCEWQAISNDASLRPRSDDSIVKEFYLRWAMKEAYTKALGVGLYVDFDSFEIRLIGHDVDSTNIEGDWKPRGSLWGSITTDLHHCNSNGQVEHQVSFVGQVMRMREPRSDAKSDAVQNGYWVFTFVPLVDGLDNNSKEPDNSTISGCICICKGPFDEEADAATSSKSIVNIENLTLLELIQMHGKETLI